MQNSDASRIFRCVANAFILTMSKRKIVNLNVSSGCTLLSRSDIVEILKLRVNTGAGRASSSRHNSDVWNYFGNLFTESENACVSEQQQQQQLKYVNSGRVYCS